MKKDIKPIPPPSVEKRRELIEQVNAVRSYVHLLLPRWSNESGKEIATAVMLRAGNYLFALTANHCVRPEMSLIFTPGKGQNPRSQILKTITRDPLDIAVLELEDRPDVLACQVEQLCIDVPKPVTKNYDPNKSRLFWFIGFPARFAEVPSQDVLSVAQIAFGTNLISANADQLAFYYHEEALGIHQDLSYASSPLPETPHGFSGGGVWAFDRPEEERLFDPVEHVRLYGIQYAWQSQDRLLKRIPARVVVEMLWENYPDLKNQLEKRFPALQSSESEW